MPALTLTPDEIADAIAKQPLPPTGLEVDVDLVDGGVRLDLTAGNRWLYKPIGAVAAVLLGAGVIGSVGSGVLDPTSDAQTVATVMAVAGFLLGIIGSSIATSAYQAKASIFFGGGRLVVAGAFSKQSWPTHTIAQVRLRIDPNKQITEVLLGIPGEKVFASMPWNALEVVTTDGVTTAILRAFNMRDREWVCDVLNDALGLDEAELIEEDGFIEAPGPPDP